MFPQHAIPLEILNRAGMTVCCDGAAVKLLQYGKEPSAIVGDMDSLPAELKTAYSDRIFYDGDQETNDQTKAVSWCRERKINPVIILGATGLREDHTIGNISLLAEYVDFMDIVTVTDTGIFVPVNRSKTFKCRAKQQISIFSVSPFTKITSAGLKYEISERCFTNWYQGTLNETLYDSFHLDVNTGKLIVYFEHFEDTDFITNFVGKII
jgi:thiamine pyrophosphokinase